MPSASPLKRSASRRQPRDSPASRKPLPSLPGPDKSLPALPSFDFEVAGKLELPATSSVRSWSTVDSDEGTYGPPPTALQTGNDIDVAPADLGHTASRPHRKGGKMIVFGPPIVSAIPVNAPVCVLKGTTGTSHSDQVPAAGPSKPRGPPRRAPRVVSVHPPIDEEPEGQVAFHHDEAASSIEAWVAGQPAAAQGTDSSISSTDAQPATPPQTASRPARPTRLNSSFGTPDAHKRLAVPRTAPDFGNAFLAPASSHPQQLSSANKHEWHPLPLAPHTQLPPCNGPHCRALLWDDQKRAQYRCYTCKSTLAVCCGCSQAIDALCGLRGTGAGWGCPRNMPPLEYPWITTCNAADGSQSTTAVRSAAWTEALTSNPPTATLTPNPPTATPIPESRPPPWTVDQTPTDAPRKHLSAATTPDQGCDPTSAARSAFRAIVEKVIALRRRIHNAQVPRHDWEENHLRHGYRTECRGPVCRRLHKRDRKPFAYTCMRCPGRLRVCEDCRDVIDETCRAGDGGKWVCGEYGKVPAVTPAESRFVID